MVWMKKNEHNIVCSVVMINRSHIETKWGTLLLLIFVTNLFTTCHGLNGHVENVTIVWTYWAISVIGIIVQMANTRKVC